MVAGHMGLSSRATVSYGTVINSTHLGYQICLCKTTCKVMLLLHGNVISLLNWPIIDLINLINSKIKKLPYPAATQKAEYVC